MPAWSSIVDTVDTRLGDRLDQLVCAHHRRRLHRLGWISALDGGPRRVERPEREGNAVDVLLDGEEALPAMVAAITNAKSHVHIAGWQTSPDFRPLRGSDAPTLREILADVAERVPVRMLMWAGPPLPVFQPTRRMAREACAGFTTGTKVRCELDKQGTHDALPPREDRGRRRRGGVRRRHRLHGVRRRPLRQHAPPPGPATGLARRGDAVAWPGRGRCGDAFRAAVVGGGGRAAAGTEAARAGR